MAAIATAAILAFCLYLNLGLCRMIVPVASNNSSISRVVPLEFIPRDSPLAATSNRSATFLRGLTENGRILCAIRRSHEQAATIQRGVHKLCSANPGQDKALSGGYQAPVSTVHAAFLLKLSIGSPSSQFLAILDIGSDLIWTQCQPCESCYEQPTPIFEPSTSTTYRPCAYKSAACRALPPERSSSDSNGHCRYTYHYVDDSSTALSGAPFVDIIENILKTHQSKYL